MRNNAGAALAALALFLLPLALPALFFAGPEARADDLAPPLAEGLFPPVPPVPSIPPAPSVPPAPSIPPVSPLPSVPPVTPAPSVSPALPGPPAPDGQLAPAGQTVPSVPAVQPGLKAEGEEPPVAGKPQSATGLAFWDDAAINFNLYYAGHKRDRYNMERGAYDTIISHGSMQGGVDFSSGYLGNFLGLEAGVYGSYDLYNHGVPDHEMGFLPWGGPWRADWDIKETTGGGSFYKAHIKGKLKNLWFKGGYFQPAGPGVLGVNWACFPGTYLGGEAGFDYKGLAVAAAYVTEYKAPWFKKPYSFFQADSETPVNYLWSLGGRYSFANGFTLELGWGEAENFLKNGQVKAGYATPFYGGTLKAGYQFYLMLDSEGAAASPNNIFHGPAMQHYLFSRYERGNWDGRLELTWSLAPQENPRQPGYFAYRLVTPYGGANGAYEAWWDSRSDWNHDNERAVFGGLWYSCSNSSPGFLKYLEGTRAGVSLSYGWGGRAFGLDEKLRESAWSADLGYTVPKGPLRGAFIKAHYTRYYNHSGQASWVGFKNAFQDEDDFKLLVGIKF